MSMGHVSVVLPVRNGRRYLRSALKSIQSQTHPHWELVVVDDGSTDDGPEIVARQAASDPRIRLVSCAGSGLCDALNTGYAAARYDLVARLDADDVAHPRRLERQVARLQAEPDTVAVGSYGWRTNARGLPIARLRTGPGSVAESRRAVATGHPVMLTASSVTMRRRALEQVGGARQDYYPADDHKMWTDLSRRGDVYAIPERLVRYRVHTASLSVTSAEMMVLQSARIKRELERGSEYPSWEAFEAEHRDAFGDWVAASRQVLVCRSVGRALVNGQFRTALHTGTHHGLRLRDLRGMVLRSIRG